MPRPKRNKEILLTGALGDVVALVAFMPIELRRSIKTIHWAGKRGNQLINLFDNLPDFKGVKHDLLFDKFQNRSAFHTLEEVEQATGINLENVDDWSIAAKFPKIKAGIFPYVGCPFIDNNLADIGTIELPDRFYAIQGASISNSPIERGYRDLLPLEWERITNRLNRENIQGVVLNLPGETLPTSPRIVDRRGLNLAESIEVVKDPRCVGFIGIDSWLSIVACHRFNEPNKLTIRTKNHHYIENQAIYAAPHRTELVNRAPMPSSYNFIHLLIP